MAHVSIVVPCRNEIKVIRSFLNSILEMESPTGGMEIIIADGLSDDGTRDVISEYVSKNPKIKLIDNHEKVVPNGLNNAIKSAKGKIIIRLDAHSVYPKNYVIKLVEILEQTGAENVGACWETIPGAPTKEALAIALATSHPFGVGNATYRLSSNSSEPFEADTVPFGCYRREVFEKIGLFDEELIRNQDNEFNERLLRAGGKILLIPDLKIKYYARENLLKLCQMFYQYAYFGPLVDLKLGKKPRFRRIIPSIFVFSITFFAVLGVFVRTFRKVAYAILLLYFFTNLIVSAFLSIKNMNLKLLPYLFAAFGASHFSYGFGYIKGYADFNLLGRKSVKSTPLSR